MIKASLKAKTKVERVRQKNTINEKVKVRNTATTVVVQDITPVTVGVQSDLHKLDLLHRLLLASVSQQRSSEPAISDASTSVITQVKSKVARIGEVSHEVSDTYLRFCLI